MVLEDHKQQGKRFIPKIKLGKVPLAEIKYCETILPEIIWMSFVLNEYGDSIGFEYVARFLKISHEIQTWDRHPEFTMVSYFNKLSSSQRDAIITKLAKEELLDKLRTGVGPFLRVFPTSNPLAFLFTADMPEPTDYDIEAAGAILSETLNRWSKRGTVLQSLVAHYSFNVGKLTIAADLQIPKFEAIFNDFDSKDAQIAGGFVRNMVSQLSMVHSEHGEVDFTRWRKLFWDNGTKLFDVHIETTFDFENSSDAPYDVFQSNYGAGCLYLLEDCWRKIPKSIYESEASEVIGALISRQCELTIKLARTIDIWDWQVGPLLLRTMTDCHITLAWVLADPLDRARKFIDHGLGQEKLLIEHYRSCLDKCSTDEERAELLATIDLKEATLNSQHFSFLQDVNIGSWSGISTRAMAEDIDCLDLYRFAYTPYSFCAHSTWNHIGLLNCLPSDNPFHKHIRQPFVGDTSVDPSVFMNSAKYYEKSLTAIANKFEFDFEQDLDLPWLLGGKNLNQLGERMNSDGGESD